MRRPAHADNRRVAAAGTQRMLVVVALAVIAGAAAGWRPTASHQAPAVRAQPDGARYRLTATQARGAGIPVLPAPETLRFAPDTAPADRQSVLAAVAAARPEARRLIDLVAGLVTVSVGPAGAGNAGLTRPTRDGYELRLDMGPVFRANGQRGIDRLVLHELAHVVDAALVPTTLERTLDAATPVGFGCDDGGQSGACAPRAERFAESFAKWATGDIGVDVWLGYRVPPPPADWGAPLASLAR